MYYARILLVTTALSIFCTVAPGLGAVSGVATSDEPGSPAIGGALVRTEGDPGYSAITAADGSYSLSTVPGTYTLAILISAPGHYPQRTTVSVNGSSPLTVNASLVRAGSQIQSQASLTLPAPLDCGLPASAPAAPGDAYSVSFADMSSLPAAGAPQITGWNETVKPNESFTIAGVSLTTKSGADAGTDTTVWVWADTAGGGVLKQAKLWRVTDKTLTALMPDDIPFGMYLVWVENSAGASAPICINKTTSHWVGPLGNGVQAGNKKRVYGRNITRYHSTSAGDSYVYIQPAAGGSMISCPTDSANPYMVQFTVPLGTPNGNYKVFVHNGHGGRFGWSDGLDLVVRDEWVRDSYQINLSPSGGDDTVAIQNAINTVSTRPNGGTVKLSSGNFKTYAQIWVKDKVRLAGDGMDATSIQLRSNSGGHDYVRYHGAHITIEGLTLNACLDSVSPPTYSIMNGPYPDYMDNLADDMKFINMRLTGDYGTDLVSGNGLGYNRAEAVGCEIYRKTYIGDDGWMHNCKLYGGPYGFWQDTPRIYFETDAAFTPGQHTTFEYNHCETKNWPVNPANGSLNYKDWMVYPDWSWIVWCKRVAIMGGSYSITYRNYFAYTTTKDVAVDDNMGEMMLTHGAGQSWFGNLLSTDGLTLNLRTDGTVNGVAARMTSSYSSTASDGGIDGGTTVPDIFPHWRPLDGQYAIIIGGKGLGQSRKIVSHTPTSVTVDRPWIVQPDTTSIISLNQMHLDTTIYRNDFNAFPVGFNQRDDPNASRAIMIEASGQNNAAEGNTSHRTNGGRDLQAISGGPSWWNTFRDEAAYDCHNWGFISFYYGSNPYGPVLIGNAFRNCSGNVYASSSRGAMSMSGDGAVCEGANVTAKMSLYLPGAAPPADPLNTPYPDGFVLYRNSSATVVNPPLATVPAAMEPVYIGATDGKQFLINNSYSGGAQNYYLASGLSSYSIPAPLYKLARFTGYAGYPVQEVMVPVANAGIASMTWTVTPSDPWIIATIQSNGTLSGESTLGRLLLSVDSNGMSVGAHWGYVTVNTGSQSVRVGVRFDVLAGTPAQSPAVASFAATPAAGAAPVTTVVNGSGSSSPNGGIVSYSWDFADGSYGSGVSTSHVYQSPGTYTIALTVTDNVGSTDTAWANVTVSPALTNLSLTSSVNPPVAANTPVALTVSSVGGYQVQYKFLVNDGTGWQTLRDYQSGNTCNWTRSASACYELKVYAKNTGSTNAYDVVSNVISFPVGLLPTGMKLWLKADAGVSSSGGLVSSWTDQSGTGNSVTQTTGNMQPSLVAGAINGRSVIRFTGPGQVMQSPSPVLTGGTSFTTFTVGRFSQIPSNTYQYLWWNGVDSITGGYGCYLFTNAAIRTGWGSNNAAPIDGSAEVVGTLYRICSRFTSSSGSGPNEMWINGGPLLSRTKGSSQASNLSGGAFIVGNFGPSSGSGLYGDITEIIIYDRALSDTERSNVDSYLTARWTPPTTVAKDRLRDVKTLGDGALVSITSSKTAVTASGTFSDGSVYVTESDRTCGMKITGAGTVALWDNLILTGTTDTDVATGERVLRVTGVSSASGTELVPLGMAGKAFTASGQLVRVWGKVTAKAATYITLDDGSGSPVRVETDGLAAPITKTINIGDYMSATGPSAYMAGGVACLRVRADSDIQVY